VVRAFAVTARGEKAAVQDVELPEPGPVQVRVRVEAASINGIDAAVAAGYLWDLMPHQFPVVIGRDFAGTVQASGADVSGFRVGDRVAGVITAMALGAGAVAEVVVVDADGLVPVPDGVTSVQAAAVGLAAVTARDLVDALQLASGDVVLVAGGTGGVGAFAVQMVAATRATVLAAARPDRAAADFVRALGARHAVDYTGDIGAAVRAVAPEGVTAVVHAAGDATTLAALLQPGGRLASALGASGETVGRDDVTVTPVMAVASPAKLAALLDAVAAGSLTVPVAQTYDVGESEQALAAFAAHKLGKLVVTVG